LAKQRGVKLAIGTDAHQIGQFWMMRLGTGVARRGWLQKEDVINTYRIETLIKYLRRKAA
jgi:DNA polymerase (family 10)